MSEAADKFAEPFTFVDFDDRLVERPLREMVPIEALRAWHFHCHEAEGIVEAHLPSGPRPSADEIAKVHKADRLWRLIEAALGDQWQDGVSMHTAVHRFWPFRRPN